jgi:esterase
MLATIHHPGPDGPTPLVIAHGLFGSARNWGVIARRLSDGRTVTAVDMRNHGQSPWYPTHSYPDLAADLAEVIGTLGRPVDLMGHSMGGKAAMVLALTRPDLIRRLIVLDIAPVAYGHSQQAQIDAMRRVDLAQVSTRAEAEAMMQADTPAIAAFLLQSLDLGARTWRLNLDVLQAEMGKIVGFPAMAGQFSGPTLFLAGADSAYVRDEHRPLIRAAFPAARIARIHGAGHWLHAEKPREVEGAVRAFLDS